MIAANRFSSFCKVDSVELPATVLPVNVTYVTSPFCMKIYEINNYSEDLDAIYKTILYFWEKGLIKKCKNVDYKIESTVIVHQLSDNNELKLLARGIIKQINDAGNYYIYLCDYGTVTLLSSDEFTIVPSDMFPQKFLTRCVGLSNILPVSFNKKDNTLENKIVVLENWLNSSIQFVINIMNCASSVFFDPLIIDNHDHQFGEMYVTIKHKLLKLSKLLILNNYAIYLSKDISAFVDNINPELHGDKNITLSETCNIIKQSYKTPLDINYSSDSSPEKQSSEMLSSRDSESSLFDIHTSKKIKVINKMEDNLQKVLVYGYEEYECLSAVSDAKFAREIHKVWMEYVHFNRPKRIQAYMWPAIRKGLNVVAIGTHNSGKTYGYIFAITSIVTRYQIIYPRKPLVLILCSTSVEVLNVQALCELFLQSFNIKCVGAFNGKPDKTLAAEIYNGCQILISTPEFLSRFMKRTKNILNFDEIRHLIFDNADVIIEKYYITMIRLIKKYNLIKEKNEENLNPQIIAVSRHCTKQLRQFVSCFIEKPFICISSFLEAMIFKSINPNMYVASSNIKKKILLEILNQQKCFYKIVILCTNMNEAEELNDFLKQYRETVLAHEDMNVLHLNVQRELCWSLSAKLYSILICTDDVLSGLNITDADWLIHYSMGLKFKSQFNYRFSTLLEHLRKEKPKCKISIFIDETNDLQFLSITTILKRLEFKFDENMRLNIDKIAVSLDKMRKDYELCDNVKSLGFCPNQSNCMYRHCVISEVDKSMSCIEINDRVKFHIIDLHSANHFSARIIECIKSETLVTSNFSRKDFIDIPSKMHEFYKNFSNRKRCASVIVGGIYGLEETIETFKRVKVLCIYEESHFDEKRHADVRCIDSGNILKVDVRRLLNLPDNLTQMPVHVVEVFLDNIVPYDNEYVWSRYANDAAFEWFSKNLDSKSYIIGTVSLHLGNTIWLSNLECGTEIIGYNDLIRSELKSYLIENNHAVVDKSHMQKLYKLCENAEMTMINGFSITNILNAKNMTDIQ